MAWMDLVRGAALAAIVVFTTATGAAAQCADSIPGSTAELVGVGSVPFYWIEMTYGVLGLRVMEGELVFGYYRLENGSTAVVRCETRLR